MPSTDWLDGLESQLSSGSVLRPERDDLAAYEREWRGRYHSQALAVLRPDSTDSLSAMVQACTAHGVAMVPQGGNTGLVGGAVTQGERSQVIIQLGRMKAIRRVDSASSMMVAEAGVPVSVAQDAASAHGLRLAVDLASSQSATIGGILATNAGGVLTVSFGNARAQVLGLEAVLADGRVWHGLSEVRKDNTGYALKDLLVGSEGTLGLITAAALALVPAPKVSATAWVGVASVDEALALLQVVRSALSDQLRAFELMPALAVELVIKARAEQGLATRAILDEASPWQVLISIDSADANAPLEARLMETLMAVYEAGGVVDVVIAQSQTDEQAMWMIREGISDAQQVEGVALKHDISVPTPAFGEFIDQTHAGLQARVPGVRLCAFGHLADGNLHFNLVPPVGQPRALVEHEAAIVEYVLDQVDAFQGSMAAEHGVGLLRRDALAERADPTKLWALGQIKQALDPHGLFNPGKVI
ncbi:MAG: FAD-binding oxidoreductase [Wenzhouxiangella sp.]|nr:FAD-binding oxidoreductase [Wenzhouxiangella sp.]